MTLIASLLAVVLLAPPVGTPAPDVPSAEQQAEAARDQQLLESLRARKRARIAQAEATYEAYLAREWADARREELLAPYKGYSAMAGVARLVHGRIDDALRSCSGLRLPALGLPRLQVPGDPELPADAEAIDPRDDPRRGRDILFAVHIGFSKAVRRRTGVWLRPPEWLYIDPPTK